MANDDIQGTILDEAGNPIEGAIVELTLADGESGDAAVYTTTDANGDFIFEGHPQGDGTSKEWHITAYWEDGSGSYNTYSKPNVSASLPEGGVIPDSALDQFVASGYDPQAGDWVGEQDNLTFTAGGSPTVISDDINNRDVVETDGDDDYLRISDTDVSESQPVTHMVVAKVTETFAYVFDSATGDNGPVHGIQSTDTDWRLNAGSNISGGSFDNNYHLFSAVFADDGVLEIDGATAVSGDPGSNALDGITLGSSRELKFFRNNRYAEYIPYAADLRETGEFDSEKQRLANKYDITLA